MDPMRGLTQAPWHTSKSRTCRWKRPLEVGKVREVKVQCLIRGKMIQLKESAGLVVKDVTCNMIVQKQRQVMNQTTMHLLAVMEVKTKGNSCFM